MKTIQAAAKATIRLSIVCVLLSGPTSLASAEPYLSAKDSGYRLIESIQKSECTKNPDFYCTTSEEEYKKRLKIELKDKDFEAIDAGNIDKYTSRISTEFEAPGYYTTFADNLELINKAAQSAGLRNINNIKIGSLPTHLPNASCSAVNNSISIILIDRKFFDLSKSAIMLAAKHLPIKNIGYSFVFDKGYEQKDLGIVSEEIESEMIQSILSYNGHGDAVSIDGNILDTPLLQFFTAGINFFAIAHEYAHLAYGHKGSRNIIETNRKGNTTLKLSSSKGDWAEEIEADYGAMLILRHHIKSLNADAKKHTGITFFARGPELYFTFQNIIDKGNNIIINNTPTADVLSSQEQKLVVLAAACISKKGCNLRQTLRNAGAPQRYPSALARKHFVMALVNYTLTDELENAYANLIMESTDTIWRSVFTRLSKTKQGRFELAKIRAKTQQNSN